MSCKGRRANYSFFIVIRSIASLSLPGHTTKVRGFKARENKRSHVIFRHEKRWFYLCIIDLISTIRRTRNYHGTAPAALRLLASWLGG